MLIGGAVLATRWVEQRLTLNIEERPGAADAEAERICARVAIASEKEAVPGVALG